MMIHSFLFLNRFTDNISSPLRQRISNVLANLHQYYSQFVPAVTDYVTHARAPIEKQLRDHVKLSKWDLSNYWSLKESSDKSHRKVFKLAKDFEQILMTPFNVVLTQVSQSDVPQSRDTIEYGAIGAEFFVARQQLARSQSAKERQRKKLERKANKGDSKAAAQLEADKLKEENAAMDTNGDDESLMSIFPASSVSLIPSSRYGEMRSMKGIPFDKPIDLQKRLTAIQRFLTRDGILSQSFIRQRSLAVQCIDRESISIIDRIEELQKPTTGLARKKRAWANALKRMTKLGISYHHDAINRLLRLQGKEVPGADGKYSRPQADIPAMFQQLPLGSLFNNTPQHLTSYTRTDIFEELKRGVAKCESYTYRVTDSRQRMIQRKGKPHQDLTGPEVAKATGYVEHLFALGAYQREQISAQSQQYLTLVQWIWAINQWTSQAASSSQASSTSSSSSASSSSTTGTGMWACKYLLDELSTGTSHYRLLYRQLHDVCGDEEIKSTMIGSIAALERAFTVISQCKTELDSRIDELYPVISLGSYDGGLWSAVSREQVHHLLLSIIGRVETAVLDECSSMPFADDTSSWHHLIMKTRSFTHQLRLSLSGAPLPSSTNSSPSLSSIPSSSSSGMSKLTSLSSLPAPQPSTSAASISQFAIDYRRVITEIQLAVQDQRDKAGIVDNKTSDSKESKSSSSTHAVHVITSIEDVKISRELELITSFLDSKRVRLINKSVLRLAKLLPQLQSTADYQISVNAMQNLIPLLHQV